MSDDARHFLVVDKDHPGDLAKVNDKSAAWANIIQATGSATDTVITDTTPALKAQDVFVTSSEFWDLKFDSTNTTKEDVLFGKEKPKEFNVLNNNACVGDGQGSAVVLLAADAALPSSEGSAVSFPDVCKTFGIVAAPSGKKSHLQDFLDKLTDSIPLKASLYQAKGREPPLTNALWYITTQENYELTCTLSLCITPGTAGKSPFDVAVAWLKDVFGLSLKTPTFDNTSIKIPMTFTKTTTYSEGGTQVSATYMVTYEFDVIGFSLAIEFTEGDVSILLRPSEEKKDPSLAGLLDGLADSPMTPKELPDTGSDDFFGSFFGHFYLWNVRLTKDLSGPSTDLNWGITLLAAWNLESNPADEKAQPIVFALSYDSSTSTFVGKLLLAKDMPTPVDRRLPSYDRRLELPGSQDMQYTNLPVALDLWQLCKKDGNPPPFPTLMTDAQIIYQTSTSSDTASPPKTTKTSLVAFRTNIVADPHGDNDISGGGDAAPMGGLTWKSIHVEVQHSKTKVGSTPGGVQTDIAVSSAFVLAPNDPASPFAPATLDVMLRYSSATPVSTSSLSAWTLTAHAENISVGLLAGFFHEDCQRGAMAVLGNLNLAKLDIICLYSSATDASTKTSASSFLISGVLTLGSLELDLSYQYVTSKAAATGTTAAAQQWKSVKPGSTLPETTPPRNVSVLQPPTAADKNNYAYSFEAYLKVPSAATIGSITESIVPGLAASLPDFIADIVVSLNEPTKTPLKLRYHGDKNGSAFVVFIALGMFNLTFVQIREKEADSSTATKPAIRKILRVSVDQIPEMDKIPLVNKLPQPFDHLIYIWAHDDSTTGAKGFTRDLIEPGGTGRTVNGELSDLKIPLLQRMEKPTPQPKDLELREGHHFMIVSDQKVILDHVFGDPMSNPNVSPADAAATRPKTTTTVTQDTSSGTPSADEAPPSKGKTSRSVTTALSLSALSVQFKDGSLRIGLDATLTLGPLTMTVIGFTVTIKMNDPDPEKRVRLDSLSQIVKEGLVSAAIRGLDVKLEKGPLTIAGGFEHGTTVKGDTTEEYYRGGICVGLKAWKLLAIGQYSEIKATDSSGDSYKSVFIYGKLDGPLIELEFATISGVRLGFGYHSGVQNPDINQLFKFPFVSDAGLGTAADDPMAVLTALLKPDDGSVPFVYSKKNMCWFCMGMSITAFDALTLTAVLLFEIDTNPDHRGVIITIFADGVFQMEPLVQPDLSLFYVEIIVKVELDFIDGYIAADAALAPQSHVYVPQAHLSGGASFYSWFGNNPHAGEWVITIGGYHKAFQRPKYYPNPDRLRLSFTIGDAINITGEAYVAITPKCAMAGGLLHMSLSVGPVEAWADVVLDVFINFKPFYFIGHISLSVGCSFNIDVWFVHIHISVSIGAALTIWGPEKFGGTAYIDLWFFGFSIDFGEHLLSTSTVSLFDFYDMVRKAGPDGNPPSTDDAVSKDGDGIARLKMSLEAGMHAKAPGTDKDKPDAYPSTGVGTEWQVEGGNLVFRIDVDIPLLTAKMTSYTVDAQGNHIETKIDVPSTIHEINSKPMQQPITSSEITVTIHDEDDKKSTDDLGPIVRGFKAELVTKQVPSALWRKYSIADDPLYNTAPTHLQTPGDDTVPHNLAIRITAPDPILAMSPIPAFDAVAAMVGPIGHPRKSVNDQFVNYQMPPVESDSTTPLPKAFAHDPPTEKESDRWTRFGTLLADPDVLPPTPISSISSGGPLARPAPIKPTLLSLCADALNWQTRPMSEKVGGEVPMVPAGQRQEWELSPDVPGLFASQTDIWYETLPMVLAGA